MADNYMYTDTFYRTEVQRSVAKLNVILHIKRKNYFQSMNIYM